jgi:hypothetical protein
MKHQNLNNDSLDRELDAALAKFTTAEPRAGLEDRVLANLRAEQQHTAKRSWWRWPAVAVLAAGIVVTVFAAWRSEKPAHIVEQHPSATTYRQDRTMVVNNGGSVSILPHEAARRPKPRPAGRTAAVAIPPPKLDQFPSPQPLSEQEKMLAGYVAGHRQQAILIARVRTAELKKDWPEEMDEASATSNRPTSDSPVIQLENR